jgi:hypothetical protein
MVFEGALGHTKRARCGFVPVVNRLAKGLGSFDLFIFSGWILFFYFFVNTWVGVFIPTIGMIGTKLSKLKLED